VMVIRWVSVGFCERGWSRVASGCDGVLAGPATRTLARNHHALLEELTAPHPPGLAPFESAGEALGAHRAGGAQGLGELEVRRRLGEEQLRVALQAREDSLLALRRRHVDGHVCHLLSFDLIAGCNSSVLCETRALEIRKAAESLSGSAACEVPT
jgi:hypothetical protein